MSEEEQVSENEAPDMSPAEEQARQHGWRPQEEWEGNPDEWVSAKEFNFRGELMQRIQQQSAQIRNHEGEVQSLKEGLKNLGEHNKKIAEMERNKAIKELRRAKVAALEDQDHERVMELDDEIDELKQLTLDDEPVQQAQAQEAPTVPPEIQAWMDKPENGWYQTDMTLQGVVDGIGRDIMLKNPNTTPGQLINQIENTIENDPNFRAIFAKVRPSLGGKSSPSVNPPSSSSKGGKKKFSQKDLNDEQRQMAKTFVNAGAFENVQEYVDQLVELGELG